MNNALLVAAGSGDTSRIRQLLEAGADVNATTSFKESPLHEASGRGTLEAVKVLIAAGADVNAQNSRAGRLTPLGVVASTTRIAIARELLAAGADVTLGGVTPLMKAAGWGRSEMIRVLVDAGAELNPVEGSPPLHWARHSASVLELVSLGAEVDFRNKNGETALHRTAGHWSPESEAVTALIQAGGNVNARASDGSTPLHRSIRDRKLEIVRQLIAAGAHLDLRDNRGNTPLSMAHKAGQDFVRILRDAGATDDGKPAFLRAAESGDLEHLQTQIADGVNVNQTGPEDTSALHLASRMGHSEVVTILLGAGANPNALDAQELTPLHYAANRACAQALLTADAEISPSKSQVSPVYMATVSGYADVVDLLLTRGASRSAQGESLLAWACFCGRVEVTRILLTHGLRVRAPKFQSRSPLHIVADGGMADMQCPEFVSPAARLELARVLIEDGADVNLGVKHGWFDGLSPLHSAAGSGHVAMVRLLLQKGANVDASSPNGTFAGETALHVAARRGNLGVVATLIDHGASVNALTQPQHRKGVQTPLNMAKTEEVKLLLRDRGGLLAREISR